MYAIVQVGGNQFKVSEGDTIEANRIEEKEGESLALEQVLLFADGKDIRVGQPYLKDVKVTAQVLKHGQDERKIAFKFRRRKESKTKVGHRRKTTALSITKISAASEK